MFPMILAVAIALTFYNLASKAQSEMYVFVSNV